MTNEELELVKNKYNKINLRKTELEIAKKRILELEQDSKIQEYFNLKTFVDNYDVQELEKQFEKEIDKIVCLTKYSNKVLFDYGIVTLLYIDTDPNSFDEEKILRHVYRDLETTDYYCEENDKIEVMPSEYIIFQPTLFSLFDMEFYKLRKTFVNKLLIKPQEEVADEMVKNNKQLVKGK